MADNENETTEPEASKEAQPQAVEEEQPNTETAEVGGEGEGAIKIEENPASPEAKDDEEKGDALPTETSEVKDGEETEKPEGAGEEQQEEGEAEKTEEGDETAKAEETDAAEATIESSDAVESSEAQPESAEAVGETSATVDDLERGDGAVQEGETTEGGETTTEEEAEGAETEPSDVPKEGEAEEQKEEGAEELTEGEAADEEGEKKLDEETEDKAEIEQAGEPEAEEGDRETSPVGEKLSRGATPDPVDHEEMERERLEATTPNKIDEAEEAEYELREEDEERLEDEEEEEEMVEPAFKRDELIEKYFDALAVREQLQQKNYALQHKLAEYFRKKKADERQDYDKNVTDQEQRYLKYMAQLEDLRRQYMMEKDNFRAQIEDAKERCQDKKEKVDFERKKFMEFKKQVALNAVNSRSGKPIPPKDIEQYLVNEVKKEQEVVNVRLENIKLKNKLKKKEQQLKSKEELAEGLHLIDFEQLKIENQTYNEKIEERNEELLKLRKKITSTVQVLTHLKEKLQFVQGENLEKSKILKDVEGSLAQSRDVLSRTKQARDALRIDNQKLRQNCGLLGNELLLRDFEERKDEGDDLRSKLEELKMRHAELTLQCNQVRRKIEQVRQGMS